MCFYFNKLANQKFNSQLNKHSGNAHFYFNKLSHHDKIKNKNKFHVLQCGKALLSVFNVCFTVASLILSEINTQETHIFVLIS